MCSCADGHASQPTAAEVAQTIVELSEEAILVTINNSEDTPYPLSTHVFYALDADGQPIVRLQEGGLAAATAGGRACLHVQVRRFDEEECRSGSITAFSCIVPG